MYFHCRNEMRRLLVAEWWGVFHFHYFVETVTRASTRRVANRKSEGGSKAKTLNSGELLLQHPLVLARSLARSPAHSLARSDETAEVIVVLAVVAGATMAVLCARLKRAGFYWHVAVEMKFPLVPLPGCTDERLLAQVHLQERKWRGSYPTPEMSL